MYEVAIMMILVGVILFCSQSTPLVCELDLSERLVQVVSHRNRTFKGWEFWKSNVLHKFLEVPSFYEILSSYVWKIPSNSLLVWCCRPLFVVLAVRKGLVTSIWWFRSCLSYNNTWNTNDIILLFFFTACLTCDMYKMAVNCVRYAIEEQTENMIMSCIQKFQCNSNGVCTTYMFAILFTGLGKTFYAFLYLATFFLFQTSFF